MIRPGLVSVTFRDLEPRSIVDLVKEAGLDGIEWGGDIHVPHGDLRTAREVAELTANAGLRVAAYGSYYEAGKDATGSDDFERILETAQALSAPMLRIWAGEKGSGDADARYREIVGDDLMRVTELSAEAGIRVALEWHIGTLTDSLYSARKLLDHVQHRNLSTLWQPAPGRTEDQCLEELSDIKHRLSNLHVYHWVTRHERRPLNEGMESWRKYLAAAAGHKDRYALLEFVRDDSPEAFLEDARTLRKLLVLCDR
jgi:sugar phosphate isomerase/epimerase